MRSRTKSAQNSPKTARGVGGAWVAAAVVAVVLAACGLLYEREAGEIAGRQQDLEVVRVNLLVQLLRSELSPAVTDVRMLASGDSFRNYLETGQAAALQAATQRALFFSRAKPLYELVRYLDESGQEIIRVNQGGQLVPPDKLQNKATRTFFRQANALAAGMVFISSFDLNFEGSPTTKTLKPTLRFAVPVFDSSGRRRGIYIINCLGSDLIAELQNAATVLFKRVRLLNAQGYWLKGAAPNEEWGFMLPERAAFTLARTDPRALGQDPSGDRRASHLQRRLVDLAPGPSGGVLGHTPGKRPSRRRLSDRGLRDQSG